MSTLTINLPDSVDIEKQSVLKMIAAHLYQNGTLTLGQAAKVAGMEKWDFAEILKDHGVSIFNYPASELAEDLKNA